MTDSGGFLPPIGQMTDAELRREIGKQRIALENLPEVRDREAAQAHLTAFQGELDERLETRRKPVFFRRGTYRSTLDE
jgi:hypothetical protein